MRFKEDLLTAVFIVGIVIGLYYLIIPPDIKTVCDHYGISCDVVHINIPNKPPNAFVIEGRPIIYLQNNIDKILTRDELNSILYHELGHLVLQHEKRAKEADRLSKIVYKYPLSQEARCHMERQFEYEADQFSVQVSKQFGQPSKLDEIFEQLGVNKDREYCSHPSMNKRIEMIRYWEKIYGVT